MQQLATTSRHTAKSVSGRMAYAVYAWTGQWRREEVQEKGRGTGGQIDEGGTSCCVQCVASACAVWTV